MRRYTVAIDGQAFTIDVAETASDSFDVSVDGRTFEATLTGDHDLPGVAISPEIVYDGHPEPPPLQARPAPADPADPATAARPPSTRRGSGLLAAPMPGVILEVHVVPGAMVRRGDAVLILEAMKMRNTIRAPRDGVVLEVAVEAGGHVASGDPMVRFGAPPG